jgi:hypothetical protein
MFTIKNITNDNTEHLIEAKTVWYEDNSEDVAGTDRKACKSVNYHTDEVIDGVRIERAILFGTVYVMNSNGKTVARYDLY